MKLKPESRELLQPIQAFLGMPTPDAWLSMAVDNRSILLVDHAHCEKKAASTALSLIHRYPEKDELLFKMSQLAREELLHFEQVLRLIQDHGMRYVHLTPSRYAGGLRAHIRSDEPGRLVDTLVVGAFIEARSCERFARLVPVLNGEIARFYEFLLKSESRHFIDYLDLACLYSPEDIADRVDFFRQTEAELIEAPDGLFRFHSGVPV